MKKEKEKIIQMCIHSSGQMFILSNEGRIFCEAYEIQKVQIQYDNSLFRSDQIVDQYVKNGKWVEMVTPFNEVKNNN